MLKALALAAVLAVSTTPAWAQSSAQSSGQTARGAAPAPTSLASSASASAKAPGANDSANAAMGKLRQVCAADFAKACPNIKPNTPEATACVRDHFSELSEPCQGAIMEYMAAHGAG